ncbi:MAG TPA: hypothetical protein VF774_21450 [Pseudoduganella sp.]
MAWIIAAFLLAAIAAAALWAVQTWQTNRAIANVESSVALRSMPARPAGPPGRGLAPPAAPDVSPEGAGNSVPTVAMSNDRLPPLVLPGQPVPAAVLRDLPEWVAAEVAPAQTSGASGDESAAPAATLSAPSAQTSRPAPSRVRAEAPSHRERQDRYGAVFARCPGPGESGAVQCRRAVCSGAARKAAACAPYLD